MVEDITREEFHKCYGGRIYVQDFDKYTSMSEMAERIEKDFRFDRACRGNVKQHNR